ncbi:predicted protein [Histoplasma mississippiense (nom. inval.)]|uniref:predicted protein n=1 Tax=Ajellomyces capsulatus (strain NAm1 / WU24) TaxID=2059318 RepID=UPI000157BD21|nr:predicted protein [Histoplasma mississippiense (nom. inval.)]EDN06268.1 predicted protein [Histoplasma mississippiense (nom. inval.)]
MQKRIKQVIADLGCICQFYSITFSPERECRLQEYRNERLDDLSKEIFDTLIQDWKIHYLLLQNHLYNR